jgi:cytochrome c-type biogenesis protein CcmH/NrfG
VAARGQSGFAVSWLALGLPLLACPARSLPAETRHALVKAPGGSAAAREALGLCLEDGDDERFARGVKVAEQAIAADAKDAVAHFALFCNLGRQVEKAGLGGLQVRRVLHAVDRALELAPEWSDALVGKGSMLMQLPGLMGGDAVEGERLLRQAIALDPTFGEAYVELARGLARAGRRKEALTSATKGLELADAAADTRIAGRARALLQTLPDDAP